MYLLNHQFACQTFIWEFPTGKPTFSLIDILNLSSIKEGVNDVFKKTGSLKLCGSITINVNARVFADN